jgi:type II secretory pathway pseudopilin PulG
MTHSQLAKRLRARLQRDERGFTIIEVVVAVTVIFGLLVSLAFIVTSSFGYQRLARIRQTASGLANQIMEQTRGLAYESITNGMLSTDLTGDANIVSCSGTFKLFACSATSASIPGTAEPLVTSPGLTTTVPLVPHRSSTSPNADPVIDGVTYTWSTYVSRAPGTAATSTEPARTNPYRVTVQVSWTATTGGAADYVRVQSLFWSPSGCQSTATHPYAAPCQPFFYGEATIPQGTITIVPTGTIGLHNTSFEKAVISLPGVSASTQQEQVVQAIAEFRRSRAELTTGGTTNAIGGILGSAAADSDPSTTATSYLRSRCGVEINLCDGSTASSPLTGNDKLTVVLPATTTAEADAAVQASASNSCPPSNVATPAETDNLACAAASFVQAGDVTATVSLGSEATQLGSFTLVQAQAPATSTLAPLRSFANRVTNPATTGCSPGASTDGCMALAASRTVGTINIGGLPSMTVTTLGWTGSFLQITNYVDSATAAVGNMSPLPATSASPPAGTLSYYNGTGYSSVLLNSTSIAGLSHTQAVVGTLGGRNVTVTFTLDGSQASNAAATTSATPTTSGNVTRTTASASVSAPVIVARYQIAINGAQVTDLTTTVSLGTLDLDATYAAKPTGA